jgi:hypothetical protein
MIDHDLIDDFVAVRLAEHYARVVCANLKKDREERSLANAFHCFAISYPVKSLLR